MRTMQELSLELQQLRVREREYMTLLPKLQLAEDEIGNLAEHHAETTQVSLFVYFILSYN